MTARGVSCALWIVLSLAACTGPAEPIGARREAITGGAPEEGYPAVFALAYGGMGGCTGTCIAPRFGLTAAHCIEGESPQNLTALFGEREVEPETVIQVTDLAAEPNLGDIAIVAFDEKCPAVIPANRTALEDHVSEPVVMVGYGVTSEEGIDFGLKRSGVAALASVDPEEVNGLVDGELATSNDPAGTCYGDSGGPTFMTFEGTEVVVGVTSRGSLDDQGYEEPCGEGLSIAVRADSYIDFIDEFIAAHPAELEPDVEEPPPDDGGPPDAAAEPERDDPDAGTPADAAEAEATDRPRHAGGCAAAGGTPTGSLVLVLVAALGSWCRRSIRGRRARAAARCGRARGPARAPARR